jgi:putative redox protein
MDASYESGGHDAASSPMEMVLFALGGCTAIDVEHMLRKMRENLQRLEIHIASERANDHPRVYTKLHINYKLWGKGLSEKNVNRAVELSQSKYCSVSAMLGKTAEITTSIEINPDS